MRYFILSISFCLILTLAGLSQDVAASPHSRSLSQLHPACVVDAGSGLRQSRGSGRVANGRVMQRARWRERRRKRVGRRETGRARKGRVWAINRPNVSYKLPMA